MAQVESRPRTSEDPKRDPSGARRRKSIIWTGVVFLVGVALVVVFFYWDRHGQISRLVQSSGPWGIVVTIVLMALFCLIPIPAEFLLVLSMKVFGVWSGIFYSWTGSMLGSIVVFLLARYVAQGAVRHFVSQDRMEEVNRWVGGKGVAGLLIAHILPLPFIVVNYAAGIIRSIRLWDFIWTSAVGGIPYYLGAALVFLGISRKYVVWLAVGGIAILAIWIAGFLYNRRHRPL